MMSGTVVDMEAAEPVRGVGPWKAEGNMSNKGTDLRSWRSPDNNSADMVTEWKFEDCRLGDGLSMLVICGELFERAVEFISMASVLF
jgi:hypothetical protein